jgi:UDP-2-acetamido-2,6-beta-L-arabino-hexul-4-ose reductase
MSERTIGLTGPSGFIASHLARRLTNPALCPRGSWDHSASLGAFVDGCDTIVHLAGMNRGVEQQIYDTNVALVDRLVEALQSCGTPPHVIFASSTQRDRSSAYGRSKKYGEERLHRWAESTGGRLTVMVIPNVFGPGCRPFYNSVVATFCDQLADGLQPVVLDDQEIELVGIHDVIQQFCAAIQQPPTGIEERRISGGTRIKVSELLARLQSFRASYFDENLVPDLSNLFDAQLYNTFLSHVALDDHCHRPQVHQDDRGQLFEILRLAGGGQVFFSTTRPGVIRGNHFHTRKVEWFCVLRGEAVIRLRRVGHDQVREFRVSGDSPEFISIPAIHTHQIENIGDDDLLTMFWCNEIFQPADPDTFYEQVA